MCDDLGMSRSTLTELRKGRAKTLNLEKASKIADYFGVSVDYLLGNENLEGVQAHSKTAMILQRKLSYMSQADLEQLNNVTNALFPKLRELEEPEDDI